MFTEIVGSGLKNWEIEWEQQQLDRLQLFSHALLEKNKVMDLTAITDPAQFAVRHILDCLYLLKCADLSGKKIVDIGCGAGFPGMPLKLFNTDFDITMVDSTTKRINFILEAAEAQGVAVTAIAARAEELVRQKDMRESFDIALSRAVAPLNILAELSLPYVSVGGFFMPMKSANAASDEEIKQARKAISKLGGKLVECIDYELPGQENKHRVVVIEKIKETHHLYPRRFSKISAQPL